MEINVASVPFAAITLDHDGLLLDSNEAFSDWLDIPYCEFQNQAFETYLSPASKLMFHSLFFPQVQINGVIDELYVTLKAKDGESIPVLLMGSTQSESTISCILVRTSKRDVYEDELKEIKQKLEDAYSTEARLRKLFETTLFAIHEGLVVTNPVGEIRIINSFAQTYARDHETIQGEPFSKIFHLYLDKAKEKPLDIFKELIDSGEESLSFDELILDGIETRYVSGSISLIVDNAKPIGTIISLHDVTESYRQEREIDTYLNLNMDMLCVLDNNGDFYKVNQRLLSGFGYEESDLIGVSFLEFVHPDDKDKTIEHWNQTRHLDSATITLRYRHHDGTYRIIQWHRQQTVGNYVYSIGRDITEDVLREAVLSKEANFDTLTGLHNRSYLMRHIEGVMTHALSDEKAIILAIMDLDHFKSVNDTWGHPVGDSLLSEVANQLSENLRDTDFLVRFGGEEFILVLPNTNLVEAKQIIERIRINVESFKHSKVLSQSLSIGFTAWAHEESFMSWYNRADQALYLAKEQGRNRSISL